MIEHLATGAGLAFFLFGRCLFYRVGICLRFRFDINFIAGQPCGQQMAVALGGQRQRRRPQQHVPAVAGTLASFQQAFPPGKHPHLPRPALIQPDVKVALAHGDGRLAHGMEGVCLPFDLQDGSDQNDGHDRQHHPQQQHTQPPASQGHRAYALEEQHAPARFAQGLPYHQQPAHAFQAHIVAGNGFPC